ncbi:hypothetical protein BHM03_00062232 [Ensete ventricosum]|nr:hypothetical protein BHM03_00062232 [Ensete ventricosum]
MEGAEELDESMKQFVGSGGVRKGTSPSPTGAGALYAPLGSLDGLSHQGDDPGKLSDPCLGNSSFPFVELLTQLQEELDALKSRGGPEAVAEAEKHASELRKKLEKIKREKAEELLRHEALEKELQEVRGHLGDAQQLLREARTRARRMDDELLQAMKDLESA